MTGRFSLLRSFARLNIILLGLLIQTSFSQNPTPFSVNESPLPAPQGFVNDYAGVIDPQTKQRLEAQLKDFKQRSNPPVEIAVAVVGTTGDRPIFEYSLAVARGWKIGSKDTDNPGALLFIAINDRKYFTQISRDLEDELPDGLAGSLQRQYLVPEFKNGNYAKGIEDTIGAYIRTIEARRSGEAQTVATPQTEDQKDPVDRAIDATPGWLCRGICLLIGILFLISIISRGKRGGGRGSGGGSDGGSGGAIAGAILGAILSGSSGGSSGSSSSGWSSGGGSDWGGFGGGGDFGGGGAGGSW